MQSALGGLLAERKKHRKMTSAEQRELSRSHYSANEDHYDDQLPAHAASTPLVSQRVEGYDERHPNGDDFEEEKPAHFASTPLVQQSRSSRSSSPDGNEGFADYDDSFDDLPNSSVDEDDAPRADRNNARSRSGSHNHLRSATYSNTAGTRAEGAAHYSRRRSKKRHPVLKGILITLLVLVGVCGAALAWYVNVLNGKLSGDVTQDLRDQLVSVDSEDPFYMLLLGVDKSDEREESWGSDTSNYRADSIILARIDPKGQTVTLISIPRDTMVDMGDYGTQKINAAYSYGGAAYMTQVVSEFAGVDISHYAEIDFEQFTSIVDTLGGIEVTLPVAVSDMEYAGIDLPAGTQTLNGEQALELVRTRHAYDEYGAGDYYRAANQRMVITAIIKKILQSDATSWPTLISQLADSVTTDLDATELLSLVNQFKDLDTDNDIYSARCPTTSEYINGVWYEVVDDDAWQTMMERTDNGEDPYEEGQSDETEGIAGTATSGTTSDDSSSDSTDSTSSEPVYSGTVLVLNGTTTSGLAKNASSVLTKVGYSCSTGNSSSSSHESTIVVYNSSNSTTAQQEAQGVAETLGVSAEPIENDGAYSTETDVVVILGTDYADSQ
jgi:LCP family protein required for cell wall assembly